MQHTPGPWTVYEQGSHPYPHVCGPAVPTEYGDDSFVVAYLVGSNSRANASLIAAAPEILEALKRVESLMEFDRSGHPAFDGLDAQISAAIAKATGSQA